MLKTIEVSGKKFLYLTEIPISCYRIKNQNKPGGIDERDCNNGGCVQLRRLSELLEFLSK